MEAWTNILLPIFSGLLSGGLVTLLTMRSLKVKAAAEAKTAEATAESNELDNVDKAVKIWREMAERLYSELEQSQRQSAQFMLEVSSLKKEVTKLSTTTNRIARILDQITPENMEHKVEQLKNEINGNKN